MDILVSQTRVNFAKFIRMTRKGNSIKTEAHLSINTTSVAPMLPL